MVDWGLLGLSTAKSLLHRQDQEGGSICLYYVAVMLDVYQACHSVSHRVKNGGFCISSLEWQLLDSVAEVFYNINKCQLL